jgi:hypothetical protein
MESCRGNSRRESRPAELAPAGDVELATLGHNTSSLHRLHRYLNDGTASRLRSRVLRYKTDRPPTGRNPIAQASIRGRAIHTPSFTDF